MQIIISNAEKNRDAYERAAENEGKEKKSE